MYVSFAVLVGRGIEANHCVIHYEGGSVNLVPHANAACYVNNVLIRESTKLMQGKMTLKSRFVIIYCYFLMQVLSSSDVILMHILSYEI